MAVPGRRRLLAAMATAAARLRDPLMRADTARRLAPLLRELGIEPVLRRVPRRDWGLFGLEDADGLRGLVLAGEREGLLVLITELNAEPAARSIGRLTRQLRSRNPAITTLLIAPGPAYRRAAFATAGLDGAPRFVVIDRVRPGEADLELLHELRWREGEGQVEYALRVTRALDRSRVGERFFQEFRAVRARVAAAWAGLPTDARDDREQLALLLLSRLLFLYFLQRDGHLCGEPDYLPERYRRWVRKPRSGDSFYRSVLEPLFFAALNTRPARRGAAARALGALPYLNGGLFERHALERRWPELHLADGDLAPVFRDLLDRYRFTSREEAARDGDAGVDPEMLGRVFEGLMSERRRGETGTFFTPAGVVDRIVSTALISHLVSSCALPEEAAAQVVCGVQEPPDICSAEERARAVAALARVRVLDPACGSGAFLLGAFRALSAVRSPGAPENPEVQRQIVGESLYGVDLQGDAALLCALRLWLALAAALPVGGSPPPLPNLDRRIRQGDALVDPLDLLLASRSGSGLQSAALRPEVRRAARQLVELSSRYGSADPAERLRLQLRLQRIELELASAWLAALRRHAEYDSAQARALAQERDLFGHLTRAARAARAALPVLARSVVNSAALLAALRDAGQVPFFSFPIHFAEAAAGFDLVLSNPPWVRAHRWPASTRRLVRSRYRVCGAAGAGGGQVDLSLAFLERSVGLLAPGGTLGMLLPAKTIRSGYGAGARALLLRETRIHAIGDHSLYQRSVFRADAFTMEIVAHRNPLTDAAAPGDGTAGVPAPVRASDRPVRITLIRRHARPLTFQALQRELPYDPTVPGSPWLLAPPACAAAIRRMQSVGRHISTFPDLPIRRGVVTGANDILLIRHATPRLGDLAEIEADGYERARRRGVSSATARRYKGHVEASALRPVLRGSGISAWRYRAGGHLVWCHADDDAGPRSPPPRTAAYLKRHRAVLRARAGWRAELPLGSIARLGVDTLGAKVVWQDLSDRLEAAAVPERVPHFGVLRPLVPINSVYFVPVQDDESALLLTALLNSLPVGTCARALAERAKDARFRFMAGCVGALPLPPQWPRPAGAAAIVDLAREGTRDGGLADPARSRLTELVGRAYGLRAADMDALEEFAAWLDGEHPQ
jgi:hypothetical protein